MNYFLFEIIINVLVGFFRLHLNTYVMGLRPIYSYSAGIDFRRQILTQFQVGENLNSII